MSIDKFKECVDSGDTLGAILALDNLDLNKPHRALKEDTPLTYATKVGNRGVVAALLSKGADVNLEGRNETYALHSAIEIKDLEMAKMLLDAKANTEVKDYLQRTPLHYAVIYGMFDVVQILLNLGSDINALDSDFEWTPLHLAAYHGHAHIAEILIQHGADQSILDSDFDTALDVATWNESLEVVNILNLSKIGKEHP